MEEIQLVKDYLLNLVKAMEKGSKSAQEVASLSQEVYDALDEKALGNETSFNQLVTKIKTA